MISNMETSDDQKTGIQIPNMERNFTILDFLTTLRDYNSNESDESYNYLGDILDKDVLLNNDHIIKGVPDSKLQQDHLNDY